MSTGDVQRTNLSTYNHIKWFDDAIVIAKCPYVVLYLVLGVLVQSLYDIVSCR